MKTHKTGLPPLYRKQGDLSVPESPAPVYTILGSCVAVTPYDRRLGIDPEETQAGISRKIFRQSIH